MYNDIVIDHFQIRATPVSWLMRMVPVRLVASTCGDIDGHYQSG